MSHQSSDADLELNSFNNHLKFSLPRIMNHKASRFLSVCFYLHNCYDFQEMIFSILPSPDSCDMMLSIPAAIWSYAISVLRVATVIIKRFLRDTVVNLFNDDDIYWLQIFLLPNITLIIWHELLLNDTSTRVYCRHRVGTGSIQQMLRSNASKKFHSVSYWTCWA